MRQKVQWYKAAVALASELDTGAAFDVLHNNGAVIETEDRVADTAKLFAEKGKSGQSVLVLSQTNHEVSQLNAAIREQLKATGKLDPSSGIQLDTLKARDLTTAEKQLSGSYANSTILLNRKVGQFAAGTECQFVSEDGQGGVILAIGEKELPVSREELDKLTVCDREQLEVCTGEKLQLKANLRQGKKKLANGSIVEALGVDEKTGDLKVVDQDGKVWQLPRTFKQLQHGYAVTSYASQGQTVDHVLISDSQSRGATSAREFYVSISRGRQSVTLLTSDKESLRDHIQSLGERDLASDLQLRDPSKLPEIISAIEPRRPALGASKVIGVADSARTGAAGAVGAVAGPLAGLVQVFRSLAGRVIERGIGQLARRCRGLGMEICEELDQSAQLFR